MGVNALPKSAGNLVQTGHLEERQAKPWRCIEAASMPSLARIVFSAGEDSLCAIKGAHVPAPALWVQPHADLLPRLPESRSSAPQGKFRAIFDDACVP